MDRTSHSTPANSEPATSSVFELIRQREWEGLRPLLMSGFLDKERLVDRETGWSALHAMCLCAAPLPEDFVHVLDLFVEKFGVDCTSMGVPSPLFIALRGNADLAVIKLLLDKGANPNLQCFHGQTPLFVAAQTPCSLAVFRLLLSRGADPNILAADGASVLHAAAACRDVRILEALLEREDQLVRVHERIFDKQGRVLSTPLLAASASGNFDAVLLLLERGANPLETRFDGFSPLIAAVCSASGCSLVETLLLQCEASPPTSLSSPASSPHSALHRLSLPCLPATKSVTKQRKKSALEIARAKDLPGEFINVLLSPTGTTEVASWGDLMDTREIASQFVVVRRLSDRQRVFSVRRRSIPRGQDARVLKVTARRDEAAHLALVGSHPHIVQFFGLVLLDPEPVLEMAWCCESLHDMVRRRGALDFAKTRLICTQMVSALEHTHKAGLVHLDVKPKNIFVKTYSHFVLGDFGSSMTVPVVSDAELSVTTEFSAPEVLRQRPVVESDWWSLGCTAYVLCTAKLAGPFDAQKNWKLTRDNIFDCVIAPFPEEVPEEVREFVRAMIRNEPEARQVGAV